MAVFKFCIVCLIFMLAGCEKTPEQTAVEEKIEDSSGVDTQVDLQKNDMTITGETEKGETEKGETEKEKYTTSSGEGADIPKDFPTDVFIYSPSRVMTAMDMPDGGAVGLTTADDVSTVAETYKREMTARSWSEQSAVKNGERLMLVYKKDKRIANITIGSKDGAAQIMVMVTKD